MKGSYINIRNINKKTGGEGGFVLVLVLLVTAVLVAVVVEFAYGVYVSTSMAANFRDSQRAGVLATDAIVLARSALVEMTRLQPHMTMDPEGLVFARRDGDMEVTLRIVDERSRVSTRVVYTDTGVVNDNAMEVYAGLLSVLELDSRIIDPLADWIDADSDPRIYGGEELDYYQRLATPYAPKNAYISSPGELGMIKGYTPDVLSTLAPFISAFNDIGTININTAPREVLMSLSEEITGPLADAIITKRRESSFTDRSEITSVPGLETIGISVLNKIVVESDTFRVYSKARAGEAVREVEAVVRLGGQGAGFLYWVES